MKRIKKVSFNTVQFVKRFDKTLPSNQLSTTLTEPIMSIKKSPTPPQSPVPRITNDIKDMAIVVKKSPPTTPIKSKSKSLDNDAGSHKKSKTKSPPPKSKTKSPPPKAKTKSPTKASPQASKKSPVVSKKSKATSKKSPTKSKSS